MDRSTQRLPGGAADLTAAIKTPHGTRRTHPLMAWRMTQRVWDFAKREFRAMRVADAARKLGVPYQTWNAWERYLDEDGSRDPGREHKKQIFLFTRGAIRPDHFYPMDEWRRELAKIAPERADAADEGGDAVQDAEAAE